MIAGSALREDAASRQRALAASIVIHAAILCLFLLVGAERDAIPQMKTAPLEVDLVPLEIKIPAPEPVKPDAGGEAASVPAPLSHPGPPAQVPAVSVAEVEPVPTVIEVTPAPLPTAVPTPSGPPAAAAGAGTGSGSGSGAGAGEGGSPLLPADWIVKPEEKMRELNPPRAVYDRISGQVLLHCRITVDQKVRGCRVMKEYPRGYGFGAAALKLSKFFRIRPPAAGGVILTETRVPIPVIWENPPFKRGRTPSSR